MSRKLFTEQEIILLQASPYVKSVSMRAVIFTSEFRQKLYELLHSGHGARESLRLLGIDPDILGNTRINGIRQRLEADGKGTVCAGTAADSETATLRRRVAQLEHDLAYTRQEVEFLKKLQTANTEARKQWESKHAPQ